MLCITEEHQVRSRGFLTGFTGCRWKVGRGWVIRRVIGSGFAF